MKVLGLSGKALSGKDLFANIIVENKRRLNRFDIKKIETIAFADSLKLAVSSIFKWDLSTLNDVKKKNEVDDYWNTTPRWALQYVGTKIREIDHTIWVKSLEIELNKIKDRNCCDLLIVTDVRYKEEYDLIKSKADGYMLRIERLDLPLLNEEWRTHRSETNLDNEFFDAKIVWKTLDSTNKKKYTSECFKELSKILKKNN